MTAEWQQQNENNEAAIGEIFSRTATVNGEMTTVSQHGVFMGELTMNYFLKRVNSAEAREPSLKVIKTSLIQRETTKPLH